MKEILQALIAAILAVNFLLVTKVLAAMVADAVERKEVQAAMLLATALAALVISGVVVLKAIQASV